MTSLAPGVLLGPWLPASGDGGDLAPPAALGMAAQAQGQHGRTFGAEQRGVAGLVAEGLPIMLGREGSVRMLSGDDGSLRIASIPTGVQKPPRPRLHPKTLPQPAGLPVTA